MNSIQNYKKLTPAEAKKIMDSNKNAIILDVREKEELEEGYIDKSINISSNEITDNRQLKKISDKNAVILVYCRSGKRSLIASKKLIELGYRNVYDIGGIINWPFEIII